MLEPTYRKMTQGEEYLIPHGGVAKLHLPNGTVVKICCE
jgi:hypothetical protein